LKQGEVDADDRLEEVFRDGEVLKTQTVTQIRERAATQEPVILAT
jgi:hypothetical protein